MSANAGEIFDKTQHLVQKATQANDTLECFWLREVVPRFWTLQDTVLVFWRRCVLTEARSYHARRNQFERFREFLELTSRFEFEFRRCENYIF